MLKLLRPASTRAVSSRFVATCVVPITFPNAASRFFSHKSSNLQAGSTVPSEAADAAATVIAEQRDASTIAHSATWLDALTERDRQAAEGNVLDSFSYMNPKTTEVGERTRSESFSYLVLPFKDDRWLCDSYINAFGRLRAGQMFQDLDALAGRIAYRHCAPAEPMNVTASVDRIYMVKKVDEIQNYNFVLAGCVTWTGRSSMEITVKGYAFEDLVPEDISEETLPNENVFLTANFTFVARNPLTHKSFAINRLLPVTEKEWIDYRRAESFNAKKKLAAKDQSIIEPSDEENRLVYDMWKASRELTPQFNKNVMFMKDTTVSSTLFMQPQYRNRHSYMIFGGYLLRQSFELAYCAAAAFSSAGPRFVSLDSTTFKAPVPVGSVLSMSASVSYTEHIHDGSDPEAGVDSPFNLPATNKISANPDAFLLEPGTLVQVKVDTNIKNLDSVVSKESGCFIYSFFVPRSSYEEGKPHFSSVIPQTYSEMMEYVEGRRRAHDTANYVATMPK
ncbi:CIC11C00000005463 [Sungouiella intermedia]|uniref:CIC11C00000005463 n=1 Tax=Sungouiella intermedia TaxID=45354 RepID=A0A1L0BWL4_9ASCO|nr:CIC11C00000005463 [[Candida] intermedia]